MMWSVLEIDLRNKEFSRKRKGILMNHYLRNSHKKTYSVGHISLFVTEANKKNVADYILDILQIIVAIGAIVAIWAYGYYSSGNVEILNEGKKNNHYIKDDLSVVPAEVSDGKWATRYSRYFADDKNDAQIKEMVVDGINNSKYEEHGIGSPIIYCNGRLLQDDLSCDKNSIEFGARAQYSFNLRGKTKNLVDVEDIVVVVEKEEAFTPKIVSVAWPQGVTNSAKIGFDFNHAKQGDRLDALKFDGPSKLSDVRYLVENGIRLSDKDRLPIAVSFFVPPGRKIDFHLEVSFSLQYKEGKEYKIHEDRVIIKDGDKPFRVVSYPDIRHKPVKAYGVDKVTMDIVPCEWPVECFSIPDRK